MIFLNFFKATLYFYIHGSDDMYWILGIIDSMIRYITPETLPLNIFNPINALILPNGGKN